MDEGRRAGGRRGRGGGKRGKEEKGRGSGRKLKGSGKGGRENILVETQANPLPSHL